MVLGSLALAKRTTFAFVEATGGNVCVIYSDLFLEDEEMIEVGANPLVPPHGADAWVSGFRAVDCCCQSR